MIELVARLALAAVLALAAGLKLARPGESAAAMEAYGVVDRSSRWLLWAAAVGIESALALAVALGSAAAAYLAAATMLFFALLMIAAILAGRAGAACACFGARSRLGWPAVGRNLVLAACFAALPLLG